MTIVKIRLFDGPIYYCSGKGWSGPDPEWVKTLNLAYRPVDTMATNPVLSAARRAARDFLGEVLSMWDDADGAAPRSPDADRKRVWDLVRRLGREASERLTRGATPESVDAHLLATLEALHEEDGEDFVRAIVATLPPEQRARMAAYLDARDDARLAAYLATVPPETPPESPEKPVS